MMGVVPRRATGGNASGTGEARAFVPMERLRSASPAAERYDADAERARVLEHLRRGSGRMLDVGVGGCPCLTLALARAGYRVTALDRSLVAIAEARRRVEREQLLERVTFVHREAAATGFPDGAFRNVAAFDALGHMGNLPGVIREMARITARNGRLVISELNGKGRLITGHPADGRFLSRLQALLEAHFASAVRIDGAWTTLFVCNGRRSFKGGRRNGASAPA